MTTPAAAQRPPAVLPWPPKFPETPRCERCGRAPYAFIIHGQLCCPACALAEAQRPFGWVPS